MASQVQLETLSKTHLTRWNHLAEGKEEELKVFNRTLEAGVGATSVREASAAVQLKPRVTAGAN